MVEVEKVFPGLVTFQGPTITEKTVSLINQNFAVRYGSHAVCVFMMSDARHCTGIRLNTKTHMCPIMSYIFISCLIFFWPMSYENLPVQWDDCLMH